MDASFVDHGIDYVAIENAGLGGAERLTISGC